MDSHTIRITWLVLALVCALPLPSPAVVHQVNVAGFAFTPDALAIAEGDTVRWVWSNGSHTVTSGAPCMSNGLFNSPLNSVTPIFEHAFNSPGEFPYFCTPHCGLGMTGLVTVMQDVSIPDRAEGAEVRVTGPAPNPFSRETLLQLRLPTSGPVAAVVLDAAGRRVATLAEGWMTQGLHEMRWDGRMDDGTQAGSGVYYTHLLFPGGSTVTRLLRIR
ncbi:MAG: plastocyanin/azurin family copper-binding protein [Candidatus Eisenbacteria bacterium]